MMTLYLLFEAMDSGRITPETQILVSAHAVAQPPSKMRIRAGDRSTRRRRSARSRPSRPMMSRRPSANISAARTNSRR
jgi:hypothetical protein